MQSHGNSEVLLVHCVSLKDPVHASTFSPKKPSRKLLKENMNTFDRKNKGSFSFSLHGVNCWVAIKRGEVSLKNKAPLH